MPPQDIDPEILDRVAIDRRAFVRRVILGTAFAVPVISSFAMDRLSMATAFAQGGNQTSVRVAP